jgi:hypothetical protein
MILLGNWMKGHGGKWTRLAKIVKRRKKKRNADQFGGKLMKNRDGTFGTLLFLFSSFRRYRKK